MISIFKEFLLERFENGGIVYELVRPLQIDVKYKERDRLWIFRQEELNFWGRGDQPEDAMRDLLENIAYLWEAFSEEEDAVLDSKALHIKELLIKNVRTTKNGV